MAVTASVKNSNPINACESAADWTGETPADVIDFFKEGTQCVGFVCRGIGDNDMYISVTENLSGAHLRMWFMTTATKEMNTDANGGIQIYLSDGSNTGYYKVSGSTSYPGGWYPLVLDCSRTPDSGSQPTLTAITTIGLRVNQTSAPKNTQNTWVDNIYAGDGLISYGDDGGSYYDFDDILAIDENTTYGWGLIRKIGGIFFTTGVMEFGDSAGSNSCKFNAKNDVLVFEMREVGSSNNIATTLMGINIIDNGTGTTEFILGEKAGTAGVSGCILRVQNTAQVSKFYIDGATDTDVDNFKIYGCNVLDAGQIDFPPTAANVEILSTSFESCGTIYPRTAIVKYCNVINANTIGMDINTTSHQVSDTRFVNNAIGINISTASTSYSLVNCSFVNNTVDIQNPNNATTVDSHSVGGSDQVVGNGTITAAGQSFTAIAGVLSSCYLRLKKVNSPTGNAVAKVYASTGSNPNRTPTGSALAISNNVDVSTGITGSYTDVYFEFEDEFTLVATTTYFIVLEFNDDASNYLHWEYDNANGDANNNFATYSGSWSASSGDDGRYAVHHGGIVKIGLTNSNPGIDNNTGTPPGATIMPISVVLNIYVKDVNNSPIFEAQTAVYKISDDTELMNEDTNVSGLASESFVYPGSDVDVYIRVRKGSTGATKYVPFYGYGKIESTGMTVTVILYEDTINES